VADDGTVSNKQTFATPIDEADGLTFDEKGNAYFASYNEGKVIVFSPTGMRLGDISILTPPPTYDVSPGIRANTSNCVFGGSDNKTLFITGDGGLYQIKLKVAGRLRPGLATALQNDRRGHMQYRRPHQANLAFRTGLTPTVMVANKRNALGQNHFGARLAITTGGASIHSVK
jgi:hypothetical protein